MSVKIIESFIKGKKNNKELCEDGLVITENYISIIDGVTSKGNTLWQNMTSGVYVKKLLINAINNMSPNLNAEDSIIYLNTFIKEEYEKSNMYE